MTSLEFSFRPLVVGDLADVFQIYVENQQSYLSPWKISQVEEELQSASSLALFAGEVLLAYIFFSRAGDGFEIRMLATKKASQKRGLMRELMAEFFRQLPPKSEIWLEVHQDNVPARRLYESLHFKRVGVRKRYYSDGGDAWLYSRKS